MRKTATIIWLVILFISISALFWHYQLVYALPTPVPKNYKNIQIGSTINLTTELKSSKKPVFLHFFNPGCPCSRFNIAHFKSLVKQYGNKVTFAIVVMSFDKQYNPISIQNKFDLNLPVFFDSTIAASCGVYSTPQAVIIDTDNKLFYRGNYNKSRYCTDKKSNYAQIALDSLLDHHYSPVFGLQALRAYGCQLPTCNKRTNGR